jgi:hypothetical protein
VSKTTAKKKKWVGLCDLPPTMILDGHRVRYMGLVLGYVRSAWQRGFWLTESTGGTGVQPWFLPEGKTFADIASDIQVEVFT